MPFVPVSELLICDEAGLKSCRAEFLLAEEAAKKPRSSPRFSSSIVIGAVKRRLVEFHRTRSPQGAGAAKRQRRSAPRRPAAMWRSSVLSRIYGELRKSLSAKPMLGQPFAQRLMNFVEGDLRDGVRRDRLKSEKSTL